MVVITSAIDSKDGVFIGGKRHPQPLTPLSTMTSFKTFSITAASLAAGLSLLSVSGNAAQANPFNYLRRGWWL